MYLDLNLRTRVKPFKGGMLWESVIINKAYEPQETALLICDVWDRHFCEAATKRTDVLAKKIASVVEQARAKGIQIIHAPTQCMDFYRNMPQRKMMEDFAPPELPPPHIEKIAEPPLPLDISDRGCEDEPLCKPSRAWSRQHQAITVAENDVISDSGAEVYNFLRRRSIHNLLFVGTAVNMCLLTRPFAIRKMTHRRIQCVLIRDLVESMYNPKKPPFVTHQQGTELVVQHIERYLCPSILSTDLTKD